VRTFVRALSLVVALISSSVYAGPAEDVAAVVARWGTAFNSNDVHALVKLYAADAVLLGTTGFSLVQGQAAIRDYFSRLATSGDKVAIGEQKVALLDDNVAYVTGIYEFTAVRGGEMRKAPAGFTMILIKSGIDWLIIHHHSSRRYPPASSPSRRG
jgi:uncharacterized protein (TIGR02246 family)